jgi:hypothetical protein
MREQNRCTADREVSIPFTRFRWSANSSCVQLARSRPWLAGPPITHPLISSARAAGMPGSWPLAFLGRKAPSPPSQWAFSHRGTVRRWMPKSAAMSWCGRPV